MENATAGQPVLLASDACGSRGDGEHHLQHDAVATALEGSTMTATRTPAADR
jgi:hypothetical protein